MPDYFIIRIAESGARGGITAFARPLVSEASATLAPFGVTFAACLLIALTIVALGFQQFTRCLQQIALLKGLT